MTLEEIKRRAVLSALRRHKGDKTKAAAELKVALRTIYNILNRCTTRKEATT